MHVTEPIPSNSYDKISNNPDSYYHHGQVAHNQRGPRQFLRYPRNQNKMPGYHKAPNSDAHKQNGNDLQLRKGKNVALTTFNKPMTNYKSNKGQNNSAGIMRPQFCGPVPFSQAGQLFSPLSGYFPVVLPFTPPLDYIIPGPAVTQSLPGSAKLPGTAFFPEESLDAQILKQVEYYFSEENLIRDEYLRKQMDHDGWVALNVIANFKRISALTTNTARIGEVGEIFPTIGRCDLAVSRGDLRYRLMASAVLMVIPLHGFY